jgi:hypothetical protein
VKTLDMPEDLDEEGRHAFDIILSYLRVHGRTYTGGCKAFYSPSEWRTRDEQYGTEAHLIVVYDGGALGPVFSMDAAHDLDADITQQTGRPSPAPYALYEGMQNKLREAGLYFEECTNWYCAVYSTGLRA